MKGLYSIAVYLFIALLAIFGDDAASYASKGLELFFGSVFPALFPFAVCNSLILKLRSSDSTNGGILGLIRNFLICCICGSPTGSLTVHEQGNVDSSLNERSVLAALLNLACPGFIIGAVCSRMLKADSMNAALLIMLSHYGTALILLLAFHFFHRGNRQKASSCEMRNTESSVSILHVLPTAVLDAVQTMLKLLGMIVFFFVFSGIINALGLFGGLHEAVRACVFGAIEMTGGLSLLALCGIELRLKLALISFCLSLGGLCILMQANAISRIDIAAYLSAKCIHAFCAFFACYLLFPLFFSSTVQVLGNMSERISQRFFTASEIAIVCTLASGIASLLVIFTAKRTRI